MSIWEQANNFHRSSNLSNTKTLKRASLSKITNNLISQYTYLIKQKNKANEVACASIFWIIQYDKSLAITAKRILSKNIAALPNASAYPNESAVLKG